MIATVSDRPALAPVVAAGIVDAFFSGPGGWTVDDMTGMILARSGHLEETFVLFDQERPIGTASLIAKDLDARPDLTPWLAGLFVEPEFRRRGHATTLIQQVESFAASAAVPVLWLYTRSAEPPYARLGWRRAGLEQDHDRQVVLMRRNPSAEHRTSARGN